MVPVAAGAPYNVRMTPPLRTLEFDHPPTDEELSVFFPPRFQSGIAWWRERDGRLQLRIHGLPMRSFSVVMGLVVAGIVLYWERIGLRVDDDLRQAAAIFTPCILITFCAIGAWFNRQVAAINPILAYDRLKGELAVEGRGEPISVGDMTEIVVRRLTGDDLRALKFDSEQQVGRQVTAISRRGEQYGLEFLFHDPAPTYLFGQKDPVDALAEMLNLPKRTVATPAPVRDLRPPDRFTKQF